MTVFQGSSFSPDTIDAMTKAFEEAVETLPFPVGSARAFRRMAKNIVELAAQGERGSGAHEAAGAAGPEVGQI